MLLTIAFSPIIEGSTVTVSRPKVPLPKPVGESKSGVTRLSELRSRKSLPEESASSGSSSKFFQSSTRRTVVARKTESICVDLVFDDDTPEEPAIKDRTISLDQVDTPASDTAESAGSSMPPSPVCSTIFSSPVKVKSERADSPLSSPESSTGQGERQRSTGVFTSPLEPNLDIFEVDEQLPHPHAVYRNPSGTEHPPTPSPSDDAKDKAVIAPQTPEVYTASQQRERTPPHCETKQRPQDEIDLSRFYPKEDMITSPVEVISDIETDVEETQRETAEEVFRREKQEEKNVKAVAAGWKAKYTFGGIVGHTTTGTEEPY